MGTRLMILGGLFLLLGLALTARVVQVQIVDGDHYRAQAREEHFGQQEIRAPRGAILDRNGFPLATTVAAFDVFVNAADWQDIEVARKAADFIAPVISTEAKPVKPEELVNAVRKQEKGLYLAYSGLDYDKGVGLHDADAPGLRVVATERRYYPEGDLASTLIGFVGRDHVGLTGIEADFDPELGGTPGTIYFERDVVGNKIAIGSERIGQQPEPGGDIQLTIDRYIQRLIEGELEARLASTGALGGTIIVMDPKTGAVLGMASRPGFKLSQLDLNDPDQRLFRNRAVTDLYEPGSVFKTLTAAAAINEGLVSPDSTYRDDGYVQIGTSVIRNWDYSANGTTSVTQILRRSLNTGAVWLAQKLGPEKFYAYLRSWGIGQTTGVGLSGDPEALVRTNQDDDWSEVDLATNSYGQGVAASPLQVITAIASLVNGGKLMRPYIVQQAETPEGVRTFDPVVVRQVVTPETAAAVADMMKQVVEGAPGHLAAVKGYHVGGKTGTTTEADIEDEGISNGNIASFIGFAPADDPQMIMLVKLDFREDRLGGQVSAPVFSALAPSILAYLGVRPEGPQLVTGR